MRAVLDTNVVMSAIFFGGTPMKIVRAVFSKKVQLVASRSVVDVPGISLVFQETNCHSLLAPSAQTTWGDFGETPPAPAPRPKSFQVVAATSD